MYVQDINGNGLTDIISVSAKSIAFYMQQLDGSFILEVLEMTYNETNSIAFESIHETGCTIQDYRATVSGGSDIQVWVQSDPLGNPNIFILYKGDDYQLYSYTANTSTIFLERHYDLNSWVNGSRPDVYLVDLTGDQIYDLLIGGVNDSFTNSFSLLPTETYSVYSGTTDHSFETNITFQINSIYLPGSEMFFKTPTGKTGWIIVDSNIRPGFRDDLFKLAMDSSLTLHFLQGFATDGAVSHTRLGDVTLTLNSDSDLYLGGVIHVDINNDGAQEFIIFSEPDKLEIISFHSVPHHQQITPPNNAKFAGVLDFERLSYLLFIDRHNAYIVGIQ